jgi:hypothetical protein
MAKPVTGLTQFQNNTVNSLVNLDNNFTAITNALNDPLSYSNYAADSGAVNAIAITLTNYNMSGYTDGQVFFVKVGFTNTSSATTLNVNGFGAKTVYRQDGTGLNIGDIIVGQIYEFIYNSGLNGFNSMTSTPSTTGYPIVLTASNAGTILNSLSNTSAGASARVELDLIAAGQVGLGNIVARFYSDNSTGSVYLIADETSGTGNPNLYLITTQPSTLMIFKTANVEAMRIASGATRALLIGTTTDNGVDRLQVNGTINTLGNNIKLGAGWTQQTPNANSWVSTADTTSGTTVGFDTAAGAINGMASNSSGTFTISAAGVYEVLWYGTIKSGNNNIAENFYFDPGASPSITIVGPTSTHPQPVSGAGANGAVFLYVTMRAILQTTAVNQTVKITCSSAFTNGSGNTPLAGQFITFTQIG